MSEKKRSTPQDKPKTRLEDCVNDERKKGKEKDGKLRWDMRKSSRLKDRLRRMSLRGALILTTAVSAASAGIAVSALSGLSQELRNYLIRPYLQDYTLAPGLSTQIVVGSPTGATAFLIENVGMIAAALNVLIIVGVVLGQAYFFYRWKLKKPLEALNSASIKISENDLDFSVPVYEDDEMGRLCASFETMRQALEENFRTLWRSVEERKQLNAAFSHDLRTPLTVLRGYTELLETYLPAGRLSEEKLLETARAMSVQVQRLERYTESMGRLQRLEDIPCKKQYMDFRSLVDSMRETAEIVCNGAARHLVFSVNPLPDGAGEGMEKKNDGEAGKNTEANQVERGIYVATVAADREIVVQVFENLLSNAVRFSEREICVELDLHWKERRTPETAPDESTCANLPSVGKSACADLPSVGKSACTNLQSVGKSACAVLPYNSNSASAAKRSVPSVQDGAMCSSGCRLALTVSDDGCGFGEEGLRRAAEPFYRGREKSREEPAEDGEGTAGGTCGHFGLGLHICSLLCQKHGGSLSIKNKLQGGGCVTAFFDLES